MMNAGAQEEESRGRRAERKWGSYSRRGHRASRAVLPAIVTLLMIVGSIGFLFVVAQNPARDSGLTTFSTTPFGIDGYGFGWNASGTNAVSATLSTTYANDLIVFWVVDDNTYIGGGGCTDTASLAITIRGEIRGPGTGEPAVVEGYFESASPLSSVTINCGLYNGPDEGLGMVAFGISGADLSSPFDLSTPVETTGHNSVPSLSVTTTYGLDMILGFTGALGPYSSIAGPGLNYTAIPYYYYDQQPMVGAEYETVSGAGTYPITYTKPSSDYWTLMGDAIKAANVGDCASPTITSNGGPPDIAASLQSGYRQAWVNWTWSVAGTHPMTPGFSWNPSGGSNLPVPAIGNYVIYNVSYAWDLNGASINLNALSAGTTYDVVASVSNCGGTATVDDQFSTANAPTNEFVGWVSQLASNRYLLDQVGSAISGANVWPTAVCPVGYSAGTGISFKDEVFGLPATSASSAGYYQLSLPDTYTTTLSYSSGGTKPFEITVTETITLSSGGVCAAALGGTTEQSVSNSNILLYANQNGYWNATRWVSSTLSATNDYQWLGVPSNGINQTEAGIAFVHTSLVECSVTVINGGSQTVDSYLAGNGQTNTQSFGEILGASPVWGGESWDTVSFHSTGIYNDSSGRIMNAWTFGVPVGVGTNGFVPYVDPDSSPPSGSIVWTTGVGLSNQFGLYNGGSYTAQTGIEMAIGFSVGSTYAQGSASVDVDYTTSSTVSSTHELICTSEAPPSGDDYQYWVYWDPNAQQNDQAVNIHVWYDDTCAIAECVG